MSQSRKPVIIPVAHPVGSPAHLIQQRSDQRRRAMTSLKEFLLSTDCVYLRAMCKYSSTYPEFANAILEIDKQIDETENSGYLDEKNVIELRQHYCSLMEKANQFAHVYLAYSAPIAVNYPKDHLGAKQTYDLLAEVTKPLINQLTVIEQTLVTNIHRPKGANFFKKMYNATHFLFRTLIFGSLAVALTTFSYPFWDIGFLCGCLSRAPMHYKRAVLAAWGDPVATTRYELQQSARDFTASFELKMFRWLNGTSKAKLFGEPHKKSNTMMQGHRQNKSSFLTIALQQTR